MPRVPAISVLPSLIFCFVDLTPLTNELTSLCEFDRLIDSQTFRFRKRLGFDDPTLSPTVDKTSIAVTLVSSSICTSSLYARYQLAYRDRCGRAVLGEKLNMSVYGPQLVVLRRNLPNPAIRSQSLDRSSRLPLEPLRPLQRRPTATGARKAVLPILVKA
jgi:hypothetical protein